jgi:phthalate 4,5-cis-dihydrodiol dehydrogenase
VAAGEPLRVGILGLGMAGGVMTSVIANHPKLTLAAAADLQPHLRDLFERDHRIAADVSAEALLARSDIDAVYIATPHQFHAPHAIMAARKGKHVVVEKPMALSLADCGDMIAAAEAAGTQLIVGHTHGFDPAILKLRDIVQSGKFGALVMLHAFNYTNFLYRPRRPEELDPLQGGGILWNQIPHIIDVIRLVAGKPVQSVRAMTAALDPARKVDGACSAFVQFANGPVATIVYSGYDRFDSDEWFGWIGASGNAKTPNHGAAQRALSEVDAEHELTERQTSWSYGGGALANLKFSGQPHFGHLIASFERGEVRLSPNGLLVYGKSGAQEVELTNTVARPGHANVWDELYGAVREGGKPLHDGTFARGTVQLCLAIAESARERKEIALETIGKKV